MKLNLKLSVAAICASLSLVSQELNLINGRGCASVAPPAEWDSWFNSKVEEHKLNMATGKTQAVVYTIPVVVHVIHGGQSIGSFPNITQAQINSQIAVLNADYAGAGLNVGNLANTQFAAIGAATTNISFCLAQLDPDGNPLTQPGIDRVDWHSITSATNPASPASQTAFQNLMDNTIKPNTIWDPTRYFNIWITDVNTNVGLLGYATFPAGAGLSGLSGSMGNAQNDGIWVWSRAFGNTGNVQAPYNRGRTATHESGHWLGLRHIGGDGNNNANGDCNATDYCNDTPPQKGGYSSGQYGQNFGAPPAAQILHGGVCTTTGDMFMNFMDYTDDAINYMFTPDQNTRFQTAMVAGTYRKFLTASSATMCSIPAVMPSSSFDIATQGCADSVMVTLNESTGTPGPTYAWSASPAAGVVFSPNNANAAPGIKFNNAGTYTLVLAATNSAGTNSSSIIVSIADCAEGTDVGIARNSILNRNITLAPNPSSGLVNIITTLPESQNIEVSIHNSLGQLVYTVKYSNVTSGAFNIDLDRYSSGVYSVTINNGSEKIVKRLIMNK